jgi:hypothetical protein
MHHQMLSKVSGTEFLFRDKTRKNILRYLYVRKFKNDKKKNFYYLLFFRMFFNPGGNYNSILYSAR